MSRLPLVIDSGLVRQLQSGVNLNCGDWTLPAVAGTVSYLLQADAGGDAQWIKTPPAWGWGSPGNDSLILVSTGADATEWYGPIGSFFLVADAPAADNQVFISTDADEASWVTAGNDEVLASDGAGAVTWEAKPFFFVADAPGAADLLFISTGASTATWQAEPFFFTADAPGNEETGSQIFLATAAGVASWVTAGANELLESDGDGVITWESKPFWYNADGPAASGDHQVFVCDGADLFGDWVTAVVNAVFVTPVGDTLPYWAVTSGAQVLASDGDGIIAWEDKPFGYLLDAPGAAQKILISDGINSASWVSAGNSKILASDGSGTVSWEAKPDTWGWANPTLIGQALVSSAPGVVEWITQPFFFTADAPTVDDQVFVSSSAGVASWVTAGNSQLLGSGAGGAVAWEDKPFFYESSAPTADGTDQIFRSNGVDSATWLAAGNNQLLGSGAGGVIAWEAKPFGYTVAAPVATDTVLLSTGASTATWQAYPWSRVLVANEDVYVTTAGNDSTGDGSVGAPYLTVARAITHVSGLYAGAYAITVHIAEGHYSCAATLNFNYPFGANVTFRGDYEDHAACALSNIDAATTVEVAGTAFFDFDVTLPAGKTTAIDDYIMFRVAAGGANPELAEGVARVIGWNAGTRVATVRSYVRNGVTLLPSGAITCDISVIKTVLQFPTNGQDGIKVVGTFYGGKWDGLALQGSFTTNAYGVWVQFGACISLGTRCCTAAWYFNVIAFSQAMVYADESYHTKAYFDIVRVQTGSTVLMRYGSVLTGARIRGVYADGGSVFDFLSSTLHSSRGFVVCGNSYCSLTTANALNGEATQTALYADNGGGIDATGATVDATWLATKSPAANPGNVEAFIVGP